jgi:pyruvate kinase
MCPPTVNSSSDMAANVSTGVALVASPPNAASEAQIETLIRELTAIRAELLAAERQIAPLLSALHENHRQSARNLWHYMAMRHHDIRPLQEQLAALGLSSLGRAESHVLASIDAVLRLLHLLAGQAPSSSSTSPQTSEAIGAGIDYAAGKRLLVQKTEALLGGKPFRRTVRIMVTMPGEAATDYRLVRQMVVNGMDCMRINCAHDGPQAWEGMIANLRQAERELGRSCQVLMDIAGPKLRTGPLTGTPQIIKWRPGHKDPGQTVARIWLTADQSGAQTPEKADACLPLSGEGVSHLRVGDLLEFIDTEGARCTLQLMEEIDGCWWGESAQRARVASGTPLRICAASEEPRAATELWVADLPPVEKPLRLHVGDTLLLTRDLEPGEAAVYSDNGILLRPAHIACLPPSIVSQVRPGDRIWLDDGKIGGVVQDVAADYFAVEITRTRGKNVKLGAEKGINLPDTPLHIAALTAKDVADLEFILTHADMVGYSFVQSVEDVEALLDQLARAVGRQPGIVLKIETPRAFAALPQLLLTAMRAERVGVMIARGDLAVECGYERMAEVQEEVLWLCEAAHVPVIWATQVLENVAQIGLPSRAEITDAAMGVRAECVMLNKGPYIVEAICTLDDILRRMETHQSKKSQMLRELHAWSGERK